MDQMLSRTGPGFPGYWCHYLIHHCRLFCISWISPQEHLSELSSKGLIKPCVLWPGKPIFPFLITASPELHSYAQFPNQTGRWHPGCGVYTRIYQILPSMLRVGGLYIEDAGRERGVPGSISMWAVDQRVWRRASSCHKWEASWLVLLVCRHQYIQYLTQ